MSNRSRRWYEDNYPENLVIVVESRGLRRRNLTRLSKTNPEAWSQEWRRLKREQPEVAECLKDPGFNAFKNDLEKTFGAVEVLIEVNDGD